jgi:hypothetical protein
LERSTELAIEGFFSLQGYFTSIQNCGLRPNDNFNFNFNL